MEHYENPKLNIEEAKRLSGFDKKDAREPHDNRTGSVPIETNQAGSLETIEQEKNRLMRELYTSIAHNEQILHVLKTMLNRTEIHLKKQHYLKESIQQSSQIQLDQVKELRKILE